MNKTFISKLEIFEDRLFLQHVKVPKPIYEFYKAEGINRFRAQLNGNRFFSCAILSAGIDGYYIIVSNKLKKLNKLELGSVVEVILTPDNSKYGMPLPEEMAALLEQEPEFDLYFHQLTPGKQRSLIHLVSKIKSQNKRVEKAMIISLHLIETRGRLDYKALNEDFKRGIERFY